MRLWAKTFAAGLALLSLAAAPRGTSAPDTEFFGHISDPAGDSIQREWEPVTKPAPDLVYASVRVADDQVQLTARFDPGTYAGDTYVQFSLDTDEDPSTGWPGTTSNMVFDADVLGVEYLVDAEGADFSGKARVIEITSSGFIEIASDIDITFQDDGFDIAFPLSFLGDDDGRLHFKATSIVQINAAGVTWQISDWITDVDHQPGSTVPADEEISDLGDAISDLESAGTLGNGPSRALTNHLENALRALEAGHENAAAAQLEAFLEQVSDMVADGTLTAEEAEPLMAIALRVLAGL